MFWIKLKKAGRVTFQICWLGTVALFVIGLMFAGPASVNAGPLQSGIDAFQHQDYATAIQDFGQAIQEEDEVETAYSDRCLTYLLISIPEQAVEDCSAALKLNPDRPQVRFYRGLAQYRLGHYEQAIADFTQHLQDHAQDARAYYNRGLAAFADGRVAQAIADYNRAVTHSSTLTPVLTPVEMSDLYNDLGVAYFASTQLESAIAVLDQAIVLDESDPRAYFNRGCVCHHQGNDMAALKDFEQALALDPSHAETYLHRGMVRQHLGDHPGAIADLEQALDHFQHQGNTQGVHQAKIRLRQLASPQQAIG
ncbi:MAG: tetratricopeptide repeat protein [Leptolyngbya sp. SIO1E4]|nr:tetratricopeptide repeat protein [Leptolyngbya sp. SIO1E4]